MITETTRQQIQTMIERGEAARAAGMTLTADVETALRAAHAVLANTDPTWPPRNAVVETAADYVKLAAFGDAISGSGKLI